MREWGLLSNDALHAACMKENSIDTIVTYDRDFERIPEIKNFATLKRKGYGAGYLTGLSFLTDSERYARMR